MAFWRRKAFVWSGCCKGLGQMYVEEIGRWWTVVFDRESLARGWRKVVYSVMIGAKEMSLLR
jgi:hypothetical protein